jgi:hypothetical protein
MGQSSLLGTSKAPTGAKGRDTRALGPSDNSDSGSDTVGVADAPGTDSFVPVDVALADEAQHPLESRGGARPGADSDAAGTGERRSAADDPGDRAGADISVDRIIEAPTAHDAEDPSLDVTDDAARDALEGAMATDPMSEELPSEDKESVIEAAAARRNAGRRGDGQDGPP